MGRSIAGKIKINSFADLVGGGQDGAVEIPLSDLHEFKNHPFRVLDDEKMEETVQSIKERGVLVPGIVRPDPDGGYELISGHRRRRACELAGLSTMPVLIRKYSGDEAVCIMVDSNIQREDILPSEKAKAYRMKYDAMKHQGSRDDNREAGKTINILGKAAGESGKTVQRFLAISVLSDGLLELIDQKRIPVRAGVSISHLTKKEQEVLESLLKEAGCSIDVTQAEKMKELSEKKELNKTKMRELLSPVRPAPKKITLKADKLSRYFPENTSEKEMEKTIIRLLDDWVKNKG